MRPGKIEIAVRNAGPKDLTISQVIVNNAVWPYTSSHGATIARLDTTTIDLDYPWVHGEHYDVRLFTTNAIAFDVEIPVAFETPVANTKTFLSFTLIGLYVGVIPVYLGLFWFPALRQLGRHWMAFLLAVTLGLLVFLGIDTLNEALDQAAAVPGSFQGIGLIGIGAVGTFLLLDVISKRQANTGRSEASQRLSLAYMIATGIGLHNLGEGLAIGAAFNVGEIALGSFLVIGFIIQNITEGLGIIAPVSARSPGDPPSGADGPRRRRSGDRGSWIGGFSPSPTLAVLFLGIGTGAVFEVVYEIAKMIKKDKSHETQPVTIFSGVMAGMMLLWVTGVLVK